MMKTLKGYCPFSSESCCERLIEDVMTLGAKESENGGFYVGIMELELQRAAQVQRTLKSKVGILHSRKM